jgi:hypothetical protein
MKNKTILLICNALLTIQLNIYLMESTYVSHNNNYSEIQINSQETELVELHNNYKEIITILDDIYFKSTNQETENIPSDEYQNTFFSYIDNIVNIIKKNKIKFNKKTIKDLTKKFNSVIDKICLIDNLNQGYHIGKINIPGYLDDIKYIIKEINPSIYIKEICHEINDSFEEIIFNQNNTNEILLHTNISKTFSNIEQCLQLINSNNIILKLLNPKKMLSYIRVAQNKISLIKQKFPSLIIEENNINITLKQLNTIFTDQRNKKIKCKNICNSI